LWKTENSEFRTFAKIETPNFPKFSEITKILRQNCISQNTKLLENIQFRPLTSILRLKTYIKRSKCTFWGIFDFKIEVKGQKRTFLLVLCFSKQNYRKCFVKIEFLVSRINCSDSNFNQILDYEFGMQGLNLGTRILVKKLLRKFWWNWLQVYVYFIKQFAQLYWKAAIYLLQLR